MVFKKGMAPWNKLPTKIVICEQCGAEKEICINHAQKFCSHNCQHKSLIGIPSWNKGTRGIMKPNRTSFKKGHKIHLGTKKPLKELQKRTLTRRKNGWFRNPEQHKERIRSKMKQNNPMSNPIFRMRAIERGLAGSQVRPTNLERKFLDIIEKHNLPYKYCGNGEVIIGYKNPDFVNVNGEKICVETADKSQKEYHTKGSWQDWERKRKGHFTKWGWKCVVVWSDELETFSPEQMGGHHG